MLDCHLYYPKHAREKPGVHAAILAHPYAPLGGSFDDPVVGSVGSVLLRAGFVLGTFNFRGSRGSAGRTSWSGKAELGDYVSFYGFMICMMSELHNRNCAAAERPSEPSTLVLGGYSYGSMIAAHVPSLQTVLDMFSSPPSGSAQAEIGLRARHLSAESVISFESPSQGLDHRRGRGSYRGTGNASPPPVSHVAIGGFESEATHQRMSRDSSRLSLDVEGVRRSVDRLRDKFRHASFRSAQPGDHVDESSAEMSLTPPRICYLMISPLLAPVAGLVTMFSRLAWMPKGDLVRPPHKPSAESAEKLLASTPSCAIFGTRDSFTSHKRLRKWAENLKSKANSAFTFYEIEGAGHFWHEAEVESQLRTAVKDWLRTV